MEKGNNNAKEDLGGRKNVRTQQWEELHESIVGFMRIRFNRHLIRPDGLRR
jgi:hypothetical protein